MLLNIPGFYYISILFYAEPPPAAKARTDTATLIKKRFLRMPGRRVRPNGRGGLMPVSYIAVPSWYAARTASSNLPQAKESPIL